MMDKSIGSWEEAVHSLDAPKYTPLCEDRNVSFLPEPQAQCVSWTKRGPKRESEAPADLGSHGFGRSLTASPSRTTFVY